MVGWQTERQDVDVMCEMAPGHHQLHRFSAQKSMLTATYIRQDTVDDAPSEGYDAKSGQEGESDTTATTWRHPSRSGK